jgi:hypothetical protein
MGTEEIQFKNHNRISIFIQRNILLFIFCLFIKTLFGQLNKDELPITLHLRFPGLFNIHHQDVGVGVSFPVANRLLLESGVSFIYNASKELKNKVGRLNERGIIFQLDPKYIVKSDDEVNYLIGLRLSYNKHDYTSVRFKNDDQDETVHYQVNKKAFHFGVFYAMMPKLVFVPEMSIGLGFRYLKVDNNAEQPISNYSLLYRLNPYLVPEEKGSYFRPNILFGMRMNLRLRK